MNYLPLPGSRDFDWSNVQVLDEEVHNRHLTGEIYIKKQKMGLNV